MNNPLEAVTQAVNSLVTALKLPDESAKANEVLGEMSFPQFSRLLPYRDYNQESGLFMNDTTMGFMLEAIPINGANESIVEALDHMLRTKLPRGIPLCIHLMSSQLVGDRIEYGLREFSWSGEQAERFNAITRAYYMKAAATQFPLPEGMNLPLTLRHYLSMMIPPLSWMMVRGLGAGFSSVYSHFASSAISPTASAAGSVVDGNYSYGNMQTENVNGFSWSTNSTTSFGQMMYQTGSGATATQTRDGNMVMDASGAMSRLPVGINATRQIAVAQQEMAREASNRAESALHGFSSSIASAWNTLSQFGSNRGSSDSVTSGADSTMSAQDSMMASRMRSAVESYAKAHNISNEQATQELASRSTRASAGMYGDAHAEWGVKPKILGVGGGLGVRGGGRAGIDWSDDDAHQASSGSRASYDARHDIDAKASKDFKEASDYFTSRKVSESGSHTDNNADSRVDQLSAALNSAKQSYDQYTTNMTRSHEYAEMASRTESMSGQMSEDLSQQFAQYVMKHAPQDAEAILTNTSSPEIAERRRAMAWSFVQEQIQPGVDNAWRESRGDIGKGMESVPSGGGSQDIIADHQGHQAIIEQRTQDSNIRNDVKHQVDNMVTEYKGNIGDTQNSIRGEENIVRGQYSELQNHHKTEALSQNNKYNEEKSAQERMPGADSPQELMKRAKEYQDKYKQ
ncbi:TraC family protein [Escherichia coli]|uniref:TraC family protein n=1 Tax=Escherichia coli TaxID=562 RepID=UPI001FAA27A0|nr:TraC family protein [Escherichia coli]MDF8692457.1 TraC family protein [Escherichia coli]